MRQTNSTKSTQPHSQHAAVVILRQARNHHKNSHPKNEISPTTPKKVTKPVILS
ncbi:hypothetical protein [Dermatophilus congolensis]|uniref:hypothetical protein n=1 Tax=Dermatophilus congolensis TaxID=1863 RepID=UPI0015F09F6E|nr:hypothetical protein [Dermatophilus congolensis]MBO3143851.1 hypothetical protein [Dermatophilus congolensis]MBO3152842.1 hypothetical protein [Dermatophilus congolensis]MBO3160148.1 hypothetical protein [Dermatophilus congolensis]MBO3164127.1 hypothetical protein [Dermatophilus congolensis]MBO3177673.1 hypothetical protein [Dermatophilus congolensis]